MESLNALKKNIEKWRTLPLGCINTIHNYYSGLSATITFLVSKHPNFYPDPVLLQNDWLILPFIWGYKAQRISKQHLQKPKEFRSLGLPCFLHYYWAANRAMIYWQLANKPDSQTELLAREIITRYLMLKKSGCRSENVVIFQRHQCMPVYGLIMLFSLQTQMQFLRSGIGKE